MTFLDRESNEIFILQTKAEVVDVTLWTNAVPTKQKKKAAFLRARPVEGTY